MLIITAKKDGFRRCGLAHSAKPVEHQDDAFTPEQLAELQADPMLVVELVVEAPKEQDQTALLDEEIVKEQDQTALLDEEIVVEQVMAETTAPAAEDHLVETTETQPAPKARAASKKGVEKAPKE